jgi:hypothetical protein
VTRRQGVFAEVLPGVLTDRVRGSHRNAVVAERTVERNLADAVE